MFFSSSIQSSGMFNLSTSQHVRWPPFDPTTQTEQKNKLEKRLKYLFFPAVGTGFPAIHYIECRKEKGGNKNRRKLGGDYFHLVRKKKRL